MIARSLDVFSLAKLLLEKESRPYAVVAGELEMSASEYHAAVRRLGSAGLINPDSRRVRKGPVRDYFFHGLRYVFPAIRGPVSRGVPTSYAAKPLTDLVFVGRDIIPVWPSAEGERQGYSIEPLHPSAPKVAGRDERFYEILALIDALREGRSREVALAEKELEKHIEAA